MTDLLPCPFCGGEADTQIFDTVLNVGCPACDIRTRFMLHDDLEQAIAAWNTRAERTCHQVEDDGLIHCSNCGGAAEKQSWAYWNYCPNCGARVITDNEPVEVWQQASADDVTCYGLE